VAAEAGGRDAIDPDAPAAGVAAVDPDEAGARLGRLSGATLSPLRKRVHAAAPPPTATSRTTTATIRAGRDLIGRSLERGVRGF
jgi:hypothetical protein